MSEVGAVAAVAVLEAAFPQRIPDDTLGLFVDALADLPDGLLLAAVKELVLTSKFVPTIAEIRDAAIPDEHCSAGAAWREVTVACRTLGRAGVPGWSDPMIRDALNMAGGYVEACNTESPGFMAGRFTKAFNALADQQRHAELVAGHVETTAKEIEA